MKLIPFLLSALIASLCLCACGSYKKTTYYQDIDRRMPTEESIQNYSPLTIQMDDILTVNVSSLNPQAWSDTINKDLGYLVNQQGEITLPLIGSIKVVGLTTSAISDQIRESLLPYLKEPSVVVRILNFKVTVYGDVQRAGVYNVSSERLTINEAISMAGDLNITALRQNVLLIREVDGKRKFIPIDLTKKNLFNAPYFYLKNNDAIYVEAGKNKYASVDGTYRSLSLGLSAISIIAILLTR